jgi:hypothetical protein
VFCVLNFCDRCSELILVHFHIRGLYIVSELLCHNLFKLIVRNNRYSLFSDKLERNNHFPARGRNCMTHRQALQNFSDTSQVSLHKNNKITFLFCRSC